MLRGAHTPPLHGGQKVLGLGGGEPGLQIIHHQRVHGSALEGSADGQLLLLLVDLDSPIHGLGAEHHASSGAERSPLRTASSLAAAFLLEGLPASSPHLGASQGRGRSSPAVLKLGDYASVHHGPGGLRAGGFEADRLLSGRGAIEGDDGNGHGGHRHAGARPDGAFLRRAACVCNLLQRRERPQPAEARGCLHIDRRGREPQRSEACRRLGQHCRRRSSARRSHFHHRAPRTKLRKFTTSALPPSFNGSPWLLLQLLQLLTRYRSSSLLSLSLALSGDPKPHAEPPAVSIFSG
ncbi:hypothetical protein Mapa_004379 [Marchantia paleacea]|nr:hypothetical protein Mapa_004379 [Marchantia paleacea]